MTDDHREKALQLKAILQSPSREGAIDAFHDFIKPVLYVPATRASMRNFSKWNNLVECLLAISALREDGSFRPAENVTQMFAQLVYHIRGAILYEGCRNVEAFEGNIYESVMLNFCSYHLLIAIWHSAVHHEALMNLKPGALSPYNTCESYQRVASALALNTDTAPTTKVSRDGMTITYKEHELSITRWRAGLARLSVEIEGLLDELTFGNDYGLSIPNHVPDDWTITTRQYGWTTNGTFLANRRALLEDMLSAPGQRLARKKADGTLDFNTVAIYEWLAKTDMLVEKLALFTFFTAGQTPRVAEFIDHKYSNSTRPRTVFWDHGSIWLSTRRTKTESNSRKDKFIPMQCHPMLTSFLARYLLVIRPVEADLVLHIKGIEAVHVYKEFMWTCSGERMTADMFYKAITRFSQDHLGGPIGAAPYRQLCVEIGRVFLGSESEVDEEELDVLNAQAGHTTVTTNWKYAVEAGKGMSSSLLQRYSRISESWWEVTGFKPGCPPLLPLLTRRDIRVANAQPIAAPAPLQPSTLSTESAPPAPSIDLASLVTQLTSHISGELQQLRVVVRSEVRESVAEALATFELGHPQGQRSSTRFAPLIPQPPAIFQPPQHSSPAINEDVDMEQVHSDYRKDMEDALYGDNDPTVQPESPSTAVHPDSPTIAVEDFGTSAEQYWGLNASPAVVVSRDAPAIEVNRATDNYMLELLKRHFPDKENPQFKSTTQRNAVALALDTKQSFVAVMPTGSGKSLVFTLPPFNEPGFHTYVIVPSRALIDDHLKKAKAVGLKTKVWTTKDAKQPIEEGVQLVFVAMETACSEGFRV